MSGFFSGFIGAFAASSLISGFTRTRSATHLPITTPSLPTPMRMTPMDASGNPVPLEDQRVFGTPGASLYNAPNLGEEAVRAGISGENLVAAELSRLAAHYPNTYIFHSVKLPHKTGDIDHLVVQGNTVLLVDSKNWKHAAAYHVYHSTFEADYITRDGETFVGGEIHLPRQIAEWQVEFLDTPFTMNAVLVVANRKSTVSESVGAPYSLANLDGLATIFENTFTAEPVPPMHPLALNRFISMTQSVTPAPAYTPVYAPVTRAPRPLATAMTKWLVAWSFFNYSIMLLFFPFAGLSVIPLIILSHRHKSYVEKRGLGGSGLLTAVLVFSYLLLIGWTLTMSFVLHYFYKTGQL